MQTYTVRRIDPCLKENLLGKAFVHGDCTTKRIRSGIADAEEIESCLEFSILPFASVKTDKSDVSHPAEFDYIRSEETVGLIRSGCFYRFQIRFLLADIFGDFQSVPLHSKYIFQVLRRVFKTEKYVQKKCVMSPFK